MEASPRDIHARTPLVPSRLMQAQADRVLCSLAARGNLAAYDALYERYRRPITAFAFHTLGTAATPEDAEDVAQDAFTRAFAGIRERRVDGSFKAWLYTIARNRAIDQLRSGRERVVSLDAETTPSPIAPISDQPDERAEQRDQLAWLLAAVDQLPERQRDALLLKEMGGLSHQRIADELGTTVSATKKLISRGRDEIGHAASERGLAPRQRRLGHKLALAAPILPLSVSLAALGVGGGAATASAAAAGGVGVGKLVATALTVVAVGGGAVAVEQKRSASEPPQKAAASVPGDSAGSSAAAPLLPLLAASADDEGVRDEDRDEDRGDDRDDDDRDDDRDDARDDAEDRAEREEERRSRQRDREDEVSDREDDRREAEADRDGADQSDDRDRASDGADSSDSDED